MRALLKGLWEAETWSLRSLLLHGAVASVALTIGMVATGATGNGIAGGIAAFAGLFLLALAAQRLAERRGTPERERRRREEWPDRLRSWPRWKQVGVLTVAVAFAMTMFALSLLSAL